MLDGGMTQQSDFPQHNSVLEVRQPSLKFVTAVSFCLLLLWSVLLFLCLYPQPQFTSSWPQQIKKQTLFFKQTDSLSFIKLYESDLRDPNKTACIFLKCKCLFQNVKSIDSYELMFIWKYFGDNIIEVWQVKLLNKF